MYDIYTAFLSLLSSLHSGFCRYRQACVRVYLLQINGIYTLCAIRFSLVIISSFCPSYDFSLSVRLFCYFCCTTQMLATSIIRYKIHTGSNKKPSTFLWLYYVIHIFSSLDHSPALFSRISFGSGNIHCVIHNAILWRFFFFFFSRSLSLSRSMSVAVSIC